MSEIIQDDIAPEDTEGEITASPIKKRKALSKLRRELTDDELSTPAVQRMLLDEIDRLENENYKLSHYQESYYDAEKRAAILNEKLRTNVMTEVMFGVCLTVGAGLLGLTPSIWKQDTPYGWIVLVLGSILIIGGIASKVVKR